MNNEKLGKTTTPERLEKVDRAVGMRQPTLAVVIENIHDPHNFNAILRSCDAVGTSHVNLVYTVERPPKLAHTSSSGAYKWMDFQRFDSITACYASLRSEGFRILATKLEPKARSLYANDLTSPTAFVLGNEHRGISEAAATGADDLLFIPMMGMSESVNVSVAAAVCLFEAMRQRLEKGMYEHPQLSPVGLRSLKADWLMR
jgi:tRNA (guanosine-2'-O-)-methyltransferase